MVAEASAAGTSATLAKQLKVLPKQAKQLQSQVRAFAVQIAALTSRVESLEDGFAGAGRRRGSGGPGRPLGRPRAGRAAGAGGAEGRHRTHRAAGPRGPGLTWMGTWADRGYAKDDAVQHNGSSYVADSAMIATQVPGIDPTWELMAQKGAAGGTGGAGGTTFKLETFDVSVPATADLNVTAQGTCSSGGIATGGTALVVTNTDGEVIGGQISADVDDVPRTWVVIVHPNFTKSMPVRIQVVCAQTV